MTSLATAIPDIDVLLKLEPEELGAKLLFVLRSAGRQFVLSNFLGEIWSTSYNSVQGYPRDREEEVELAISEAWSWLEAQGLIVSAVGLNGQTGWKVLSRRARRFENEAEFANYAAARHLPRDALHPKIAGPVWMSFMRGEFDTAVFQAMKAVEVAVREAAKLPAADIGTNLMRKAFNPQNGPLTDTSAEMSEREARCNLFVGAIGSFKNPQSHRDVSLENPAEAAEIVLFASYLLRVVDAVKR